VVQSCPSFSHVIWVAKHGNMHMDWNEVPEGIGGKLEVSTWHDLVDETKGSVSSEVPASEKGSSTKRLITFWPGKKGDVGETVELTSGVSKRTDIRLCVLIGYRTWSPRSHLSFLLCLETRG
jgi:hypothetical protein